MSTRWCIRRRSTIALTAARHRAFIAPRLIGSVVALAAFPVYIAMRGVPSVLEVIVFAWLVAADPDPPITCRAPASTKARMCCRRWR